MQHIPPPSHPSRPSYEILDWPTPIESWTKAIETLPEKKNPVSLNARVFQSPIYSHISTPLPCFNVTM